MKPKWQPIPLAGSAALNREPAFQPFLDKEKAVVVTGGPAELFLVKVNENARLLRNIPAQARIAGFAVHAGEVFVQDGPVLSRWDLTKGNCSAAINLLNPALAWQREDGPVNWSRLHTLSPALRDKQAALSSARRKFEWLNLLESVEACERDAGLQRTADEAARLQAMLAEMKQLVGDRDRLRADLEATEQASAQLIFSAPVVRKHQVGAKLGALVYVIGRDGTLHPLDDALAHMGTVRHDTSARPSLALVEWETDAHSDDFACRVYYVTGDGAVRVIDGDALPPKPVGVWPARGRASVQPGLRPRVEGGLLWGGDAQETGVFALPVGSVGASSRVALPMTPAWHWLETSKAGSLALVSSDSSARLVSYAPDAVAAERWKPRSISRPCFSSFIETEGRPLLVAEFDREASPPNAGIAYRVLVANPKDAPDRRPVGWYPPAPETVATGTLDAFAAGRSTPLSIRTQVTISLQDAYVVARDRTVADQVRALVQDGPGAWRSHFAKIASDHGNVRAAADALGQVALPPVTGGDSLYCYSVGTALTSEQIANARSALARIDELLSPIVVRVMKKTTMTHFPGRSSRAGVHTVTTGPDPFANQTVTLRFDKGDSLRTSTDANGHVLISPTRMGQAVAVDYLEHVPAGCVGGYIGPELTRKSGHEITLLIMGNVQDPD